MNLNKNDMLLKNEENENGTTEIGTGSVKTECGDTTITKKCNKCGVLQPIFNFHKCSRVLDGHKSICKQCKKDEHHIHYISNKNKYKIWYKKWISNNEDKAKEIYRNSNLKRKNYLTDYRRTNRTRLNEHHKVYLRNNVSYRIASLLRHRINLAVKMQKGTKCDHTMNLLGCTIDKFKKYLESKFTSGMNWANYGRRGWHIDHIKPCVSFDLTKKENQKLCFHYTNMQPLWEHDNLSKGGR